MSVAAGDDVACCWWTDGFGGGDGVAGSTGSGVFGINPAMRLEKVSKNSLWNARVACCSSINIFVTSIIILFNSVCLFCISWWKIAFSRAWKARIVRIWIKDFKNWTEKCCDYRIIHWRLSSHSGWRIHHWAHHSCIASIRNGQLRVGKMRGWCRSLKVKNGIR